MGIAEDNIREPRPGEVVIEVRAADLPALADAEDLDTPFRQLDRGPKAGRARADDEDAGRRTPFLECAHVLSPLVRPTFAKPNSSAWMRTPGMPRALS